MWWFAAGLAWGGEIAVLTRTPVMVVVDGQILEYPEGSTTVTARSLAGGAHEVQIKSMLGKLIASSTVDVPADQQLRLEYANKQLSVMGMGALPPQTIVVLPPSAGRGEMSGEVHTVLLQQVSTAAFSKDKLLLLQTASARSWFTCAQIADLLRALSFDNDRLEGAKILVPRAVDPENAAAVGAAFEFSSNRSAALALFP